MPSSVRLTGVMIHDIGARDLRLSLLPNRVIKHSVGVSKSTCPPHLTMFAEELKTLRRLGFRHVRIFILFV